MINPLKINPELIRLMTGKQAWHYQVIPFEERRGRLHVYCHGIVRIQVKNELELITGREIVLEPVSEASVITGLLNACYPNEQTDSRNQDVYYRGDADEFLGNLIKEARQLNSSDIHIEISEENCRVRIRIDGMLVIRYLIEKKQYPSLINKIKIIAHLDIAEKRLPQDGRINFEYNGARFDIRVSVLPTLHGEKIVLRLLGNDSANVNIQSLGFSETDLRNYLEGVKKPNGILLISGPTGSGKTTTLYATLKLLNKESKNILTIEDPIEYTLNGINQVQLKENIGLSFAMALRSFLRQDPDIIMLGEIRDAETAKMAIRAALTGHLVLSTIHTNSAWGIVSRLIDMGIAPYLLSNTLNTAVAQRLIRLLCSQCKRKVPLDESLYPGRFRPYRKIAYCYEAGGCDSCFNTGYQGRKAVYEVIPITEELGEKIREGVSDISSLLKKSGIITLSENAFELFEKGETSMEEIYSLLMN